jgi:hypothetical protein
LQVLEGDQSGLQTLTATQGISLCARMKSLTVFVEFESARSVREPSCLDKQTRFLPKFTPMKTTTPSILIILSLVCVGLLTGAQAVVPPPDGCYPGFTTAEGCNALNFLTTGAGNTGVGWYSLFLDTTGSYNTGFGAGALALNNGDSNTATGAAALLLNSSGTENTATGTDAMVYNDTGSDNTAIGAFSLFSNTTGVGNTAEGARVLFSNTEGNFNTANGFFALHDNTTGAGNTASGASALQHNTTGGLNTATGGNALASNTTGHDNTATGGNALSDNTDGNGNTAIGSGALSSNNADSNTAVGADALSDNTAGDFNTAIGDSALVANTNGVSNTACGDHALDQNSVGNSNVAIGREALGGNTSGSGNVAVGFAAGSNVIAANNVISIGSLGADVDDSCYIGNIWQQSGGSQAVYVNASGKLGAQVSSRRFKDEIKPMEQASEVIYSLRPVSFRYKPEIEPTGPPSFGLIAEDVEAVNPDLVLRDNKGEPYSVRYDQVNAMLLNEFLKAHRKMEEQEATIAQLKADGATQQAVISDLKKRLETVIVHLEEQDSKIERVNDRLELHQPVPQLAIINP